MRHDGKDPLSVLLAARPAFGTGTEAERLAELTDRVLPRGDVDWLEVGAGDGRHLTYQMNRLSAHRRIRVVALEPSESGCPPASGAITWLQSRVEDYEPDRRFDWINMRHCAYYLGDPVAQIERLSASLGQHGALALTHWSRECVLYRLHLAICGATSDTAIAGIEDLASVLDRNPRLVVSEIERHETELLVDRVAADPTIGSAVFELARRGRGSCLPARTDPAEFITRVLGDMPNAGARLNGVALVRRSD